MADPEVVRGEFRERLKANLKKHKSVLDRLAREGDCGACNFTLMGCDEHRAPTDMEKRERGT